jgi:uncharacterized membrane protein YgcG
VSGALVVPRVELAVQASVYMARSAWTLLTLGWRLVSASDGHAFCVADAGNGTVSEHGTHSDHQADHARRLPRRTSCSCYVRPLEDVDPRRSDARRHTHSTGGGGGRRRRARSDGRSVHFELGGGGGGGGGGGVCEGV